MTKETRNNLILLIVVSAAIVGIVLWLGHEREQRERQLAAARAVNVLPAGVEESWTGYVDRRFVATLQRRGDMILAAGLADHVLHKTTLVSRTMPYRFECDQTLGAVVIFGAGEDEHMAPIFGLAAGTLDVEPPPALGVDESSIAARALSDRLCQRTAENLKRFMALR